MRPLGSTAVPQWICAILAGLSFAAAIAYFFAAAAFAGSKGPSLIYALIALAVGAHWLAVTEVLALLERIANRKS